MTRKWTIILVLAALIREKKFQFAPFFAPPPQPILQQVPVPVPVPQPVPQPVPVPVPHPVPVPIAFQIRRKTTTTTKAPESSELSLAYPIPMPIQLAAPPHPMPSFCKSNTKNNKCPPCPPCVCAPLCTPSFFSYCSPCHKKCRCVNGANAPVPMPPYMSPPMAAPMPLPVAPSPILIVPFPPIKSPTIVRHDSCTSSEYSEDSDSDSSTENRRRFRIRRKNHNRRKNYRRPTNFRKSNNFRKNIRINNAARKSVQPVLSYISSDGDVKFEKKLTKDDVETLLKKEVSDRNNNYDNYVQSINLKASEDPNRRSQLVLTSRKSANSNNRNQKSLISMDSGNNELVFKPLNNKRISNLSLSFQVS